MKTTIGTQDILDFLATVLIFSVILAFIIAGYNLAIGNFHQSVYL